MQQTFQVGLEPRINLTRIEGSLEVHGWDKREISLECDDENQVQQEGNTLTLLHCNDDLTIWAPYDTDVRVNGLAGDAEVQDIRRIELVEVKGDVELTNIGADANLENIGEAVSLVNIAGDLTLQKASSLRTRRKIEGDASVRQVPLVEIETVSGDLELREVEMASIGAVGGDLDVTDLSDALRCGSVGGDSDIHASAQSEINLGNVGGDLNISRAAKVQVGNVGGDGEIRDVQGNVQIGNIGGDLSAITIGGDLTMGRVGGDAELRELQGSIRLGSAGGDLDLQATFPVASRGHLNIGGDATVSLPANANLSLQATVGGTVSGPAVSFSKGGNLVRLVYGEGAAQLHLSVGGDLALQNGGNPRISSANMPWGEFGQEMAHLGQEMAQMGQEMGREFSGMFSDMGASWGNDVTRKVEEQMRKARQKLEQNAHKLEQNAHKAQEHAHRAEEQARRKGQQPHRTYVRINEREWQMNPERLNDLVNRAQQAAMEGVAGAMEAVERAVGNLSMPHQPHRPHQPVPPVPPTGWSVPPMPPTGWPMPPVPPVPPMSPNFPFQSASPTSFFTPTAQPGHVEPTKDSGSEEIGNVETGEQPNLEQEREAILRMIAEGRITPEEGDMLLEGLGS